jgi:hypothetical protein
VILTDPVSFYDDHHRFVGESGKGGINVVSLHIHCRLYFPTHESLQKGEDLSELEMYRLSFQINTHSGGKRSLWFGF